MPCLGRGGLELALSRIATALHQEGAVQCVAAMSGELGIAQEFPEGVTLHALGNGAEGSPAQRLRALLRSFRPDLLHARNWGAWPDTVRARWFSGVKAPLIFSFHGTTEPPPMPLRRRVAFRLLAHCTQQMFTVSEAARTRLVEEVGLPRARLGLIPNGIVPGVVPQRQRGASLRIGAVGNLTPIKNQRLLVEALAQLRKAGVAAEVHIAGEGPMRAELTTQAHQLGVSDALHLHGHHSSVPAFLAGLDVFVLCSRMEAHPNALIEAMASGLPCVGTAVGGIPEVLAAGNAGLLIPDNDAAALAQALLALSQSPERCALLGTAARARCEDAYSFNTMLNAYRRLYHATTRH